MDKKAILRRTALFGGLDDNDLGALAARAIEQRLAPGEILFVAGEEARGLYVIAEGALRAFRESLEGREQVIHVERAGTTIAEVPAFDDGPYPSTVAAEEASSVLFIDKQDVRRLCLERPKVGLAALRLLATRLRRCAELVDALSLHEVDQRLAGFVLKEARSRGISTDAGLAVDVILTNQQIASRIGTVREVVSRSLARLQQNGLITLEGRRVTIPDEQALDIYAS